MSKRGRLITLGSFDGVHRGHQALLERTVSEARRRKLTPVALTFAVPPRAVLSPDRTPFLLSGDLEKETLLKSYGIKEVIVQQFDRDFAKTKPYGFFRGTLINRLNAKGVVVGLDFRFGQDRSAGATEMVRWGLEQRIPVWVVPPVKWRRRVVSSTEIRRMLLSGDFNQALSFLGHSLLIQGKVVSGRAVGRKIGFPTTNLETLPGKVLPKGVFVVFGRILGKKEPLLKGVCNIGTRPTFFSSSHVTVEIHWLAGQPPKKGQRILIELKKRLRGEKRFSSPLQLSRQISLDVRQAGNFFAKEANSTLI